MSIGHRRSALLGVLTALSFAMAATTAGAAGFAIFEQGARGMGFAGAFTAQTTDPSAIFHNAAGIAFLKGKHLYLGGTLIHPSADFIGAAPFPGEGLIERGDAGYIFPPAVDYTQQLSDRLTVGIGIHVPYGLRTSWENRDTTYTGRFVSKRAELNNYSINPTVAYKLADRLAVGGGLDIRLSNVGLERNVGIINPFTQRVVDAASVDLESDTNKGIGFNLGIVAKPTEDLSLGAAYRHKVKIDFTGQATFTLLPTGSTQLDGVIAQSLPSGAVPVTTSIEFPSLFTLGAAYAWNEWIFAVDIDFQQWSSFDSLPLTFEGLPDLSSVIEEDYENSRIYRVGAERRINDRWSVRGGYFYDETPSPPESVSPLLPDAARHGLAAGFSYESGRWRVDVANWYLIFKDRSTEGLNRDNYNGTYSSGAELFAVSFGYSF